ncbi:zinc-binding oxidoreductase [Colletotrichum truncatum]|uniref:Zinc-binding oxidoreductase n=1 Tax=Colletotrichum truncatum TaxID=5467 RepID=A0ACC3ZCX7_COLTU|nr:zinc-binding oxidoreductase [Colletotrichum truncatum]KAF6797915.1 zinc-binding oxidoreductase [Colletotrichum truncatum]
MATMKAIITQGNGVISVQSIPRPKPGPGEILVKVHYAAQNPSDWKTVKGSPPVVPPAPAGLILGCDFAGTVEDPNGSAWRKGQRVAGFVHGSSNNGTPANPIRGTYAEYVSIESSLVFQVPENVELKGASTIGLAFATAMQALYQRLSLPEPSESKTGDWFLVYGGATSVGNYAIQLAKLSGLRVITTASPKNHEQLKSLGADVVLDYHGDWVEEAKKITEGKLQRALDTISANGSTAKIAQALSQIEGDHVIILIPAFPPAKEEIKAVNPHVKVEWTIVYTVFERALPFRIENCGDETPEDKKLWEKYLRLLPQYLERGEVKPDKVKELDGLESVEDGLKISEEGKLSNEKLVFKIL